MNNVNKYNLHSANHENHLNTRALCLRGSSGKFFFS